MQPLQSCDKGESFWQLLFITPKYNVNHCRVREAMGRVKQIQDRAKRPRADQEAAKRMVASGLWNPGEAKPMHGDDTEDERRKRQKTWSKFILDKVAMPRQAGCTSKPYHCSQYSPCRAAWLFSFSRFCKHDTSLVDFVFMTQLWMRFCVHDANVD